MNKPETTEYFYSLAQSLLPIKDRILRSRIANKICQAGKLLNPYFDETWFKAACGIRPFTIYRHNFPIPLRIGGTGVVVLGRVPALGEIIRARSPRIPEREYVVKKILWTGNDPVRGFMSLCKVED